MMPWGQEAFPLASRLAITFIFLDIENVRDITLSRLASLE